MHNIKVVIMLFTAVQIFCCLTVMKYFHHIHIVNIDTCSSTVPIECTVAVWWQLWYTNVPLCYIICKLPILLQYIFHYKPNGKGHHNVKHCAGVLSCFRVGSRVLLYTGYSWLLQHHATRTWVIQQKCHTFLIFAVDRG
jgi:hypothetical protein